MEVAALSATAVQRRWNFRASSGVFRFFISRHHSDTILAENPRNLTFTPWIVVLSRYSFWKLPRTNIRDAMEKRTARNFGAPRAHALLTTGEVIRMLRELKGWNQQELAKRSGINASNISLLENERVDIGKKRAIQLAKAFNVHPAIIMFPEFESEHIGSAA